MSSGPHEFNLVVLSLLATPWIEFVLDLCYPCLQVLPQWHDSTHSTLQHPWLASPVSAAATFATKARSSSTKTAASRQATAVAAVVDERIEEKELHAEASESYLAVRADRVQPDMVLQQ